MKRQFMHMNPSQGQNKIHQEQAQPTTDAFQRPNGDQSVDANASAQPGRLPPGAPLFRSSAFGAKPASDKWTRPLQPSQSPVDQFGQVGNAPASMTEMETLQQSAVRDPRTEPGFLLNGLKQPQAFLPGQASPVLRPPVQSSPLQYSPVQQRGPQGLSPSIPAIHAAVSAPPMQIPQMAPLPGVGQPAQNRWQQKPGQGMPPNFPPKKPPFKQLSQVPIWARVALGLMVCLVIGITVGYSYYYNNFAGSVNTIIGQKVKRVDGDTVANTNTGDFASGKRVNILLLGSDTDYKTMKINGGALAQTDMVVTIDPATHYVGMLSFPRDAWLPIPDHPNPGIGGMNSKLDQAYLYGNNDGPDQGAALAMATIHKDFGIPINYYAWVGLDGFMKVIDVLGGVDVDVNHPIVDDSYPDDTDPNVKDYYALKRLYMTPGPQHLNGKQALEYVRTRHADLVGDFGRSFRQQQVLAQLRSKLNNPDIFGKLKELSDALSGHVKTDMEFQDIVSMMNFARGLDTKKIDRVTLGGPPYSQPTPSLPIYGGQAVVLINCQPTMAKISQMFGLGDQAICNVGTSDNGTTASTGNYKTNNSLAAAPQPLIPPASTPANSFQTVNAMAAMGPMSVDSRGDKQLYGLRSLLDLMFLTAFESPDGADA